jgi:hypothetical protein
MANRSANHAAVLVIIGLIVFIATQPADCRIETYVSWIMEAKNGFMPKAFSLVMNMDAMVGKDFEEGLANLNREAKSGA